MRPCSMETLTMDSRPERITLSKAKISRSRNFQAGAVIRIMPSQRKISKSSAGYSQVFPSFSIIKMKYRVPTVSRDNLLSSPTFVRRSHEPLSTLRGLCPQGSDGHVEVRSYAISTENAPISQKNAKIKTKNPKTEKSSKKAKSQKIEKNRQISGEKSKRFKKVTSPSAHEALARLFASKRS